METNYDGAFSFFPRWYRRPLAGAAVASAVP